jgi:hypothetical protein
MTVPHRDDVAGIATLCPDHNDQTSIEMTGANETHLTVIKAIIDNRCRQSGKHLSGSAEIQRAVFQRKIALRRIECDPQSNSYCTPK